MQGDISEPPRHRAGLTRWLVMKSCKTPVWPADVEAECSVDPDDPYDLPQPSYVGEFDD